MSKFTFPSDIKLIFSGHETFPLRQLWLRKAHSQIIKHTKSDQLPASKSLFSDDTAIERFGVGKNMVSSIKHWALACDVIHDSPSDNGLEIGDIGKFLFGYAESKGHDEFLEHDASVWLIHWLLSGRASRTPTLYAIFNFVQAQSFNQNDVIIALNESSAFSDAKKSATTITRDIETCIRGYISGQDNEDNMDSLLGCLGLISVVGKGQYRFNQGAQHGLHDAVFGFALLDFWSRLEKNHQNSQTTLAFNQIAHVYGSLGRVFKMNEDAIADRLSRIAEITNHYLAWTDQAGIRQVTRIGSIPLNQAKMNVLRNAYV